MYPLRYLGMRESKSVVQSTNYFEGNRIWSTLRRDENRAYGVSMGTIRILVAILIVVVILKLLF